MKSGIDLSRGVDLSALRDKGQHQHRFVVVANFKVRDKTMASLAEQHLRALRRQEKGLDPEEGARNIPLPLHKDDIVSIDGPGCQKCAIFWAAEEGWGKLCPVSDAAFEAAGSPTATQPAHPSVNVNDFPQMPRDPVTRAGESDARAEEPSGHVVLDERGNVTPAS